MSGLLRRAATYTAGGLLSQGVVFLLWLILPWLLPPAEIGLFALAMFAVELLTTLATLGMDAALVRFAGEGGKRPTVLAAGYLNGTLAYLAVALLVGLLAFVGPAGWSNILDWVTGHAGLVLLAVLANVLWNLFQSGQVAARQAGRYAGYQLGKALLYFVLALAFTQWLEATAALLIASAAVASTVMLTIALLREGFPERLPLAEVAAEGRNLGRYGLPLMFYGLLGIFVTYTQRLLMDHYSELAMLGVFAYFNALVIQINGLWAGVNKAWTPEYFLLVEQDQGRAMALLRGMMAMLMIVYPALLVAYVLMGEAFLNGMVFPSTYQAQAVLFYVMLLAPLYTGLYSIAYPLYYYDLRTRRILAISAFLALANLLIGLLLIEGWAASGAALSFLLLAMLTAWTYLLAYPGWRGEGRLVTAIAVATLSGLVASVCLLIYGSVWLYALLLAATSGAAWLLCRDMASPLFIRFLRALKHDVAAPAP